MRYILKGREREIFEKFPDHVDPDDLIRYFLISEPLKRFLSKLRQGDDRLDVALRWCWLEYLGWQPDRFDKAPRAVTKYVARQLDRNNKPVTVIADRTIRKRNAVIRRAAGWHDFGADEMDALKDELLRDSSMQDDKRGMFAWAIAWCRNAKVIHPGLTVMERYIASVAADADASFNHDVVIAVNKAQRRKLIATIEKLIANAPTRRKGVDLQQLKSPPGAPSERNLNRLLDNIAFMQALGIGQIDLSHLPASRRQAFVKDAMRMSPADLRDLNKPRRVAMVICLLVDLWASHHNYAPQMHRRILQDSRTRAEGKRRKTVLPRLGDIFCYLRLLAEVFRIVRNKALSDREKIAQITALTTSPGEMDAIIQDCDDIAKPEADSHLKHLSNKYSYLRRFSSRFLEVVELTAAAISSSAKTLVQAIIYLRAADEGEQHFSDDPPMAFLPEKLKDEVQREDGSIDRRAWELALHERLATEIERGTLTVPASTQHRTLDADLLATKADRVTLIAKRPLLSSFEVFKKAKTEQYYETLERVDEVIGDQEGVRIEGHSVHIARLEAIEPPPDTLTHKESMYGLIPLRKPPQIMRITQNWIDWAAPARDIAASDLRIQNLDDTVHAAIFGEGVNLGPDRLSHSTPGISYMQLARVISRCLTWDVLQAMHVTIFQRFNTLDIVKEWGSAEWSASDGMLIPIEMKSFMGRLNPKGQRNQKTINLMTWLYDRLMSYSFFVTPTTSVEGRHEVDGMFFHATGFVPKKHTTDTAGYSDIVFGTAALAGVFYVPIIRDFSSLVFSYLDVGDRRRFKTLGPLLRAKVSFDPIQQAWSKIMDYAATIDSRRTRPSQMIAKMQLLGASHELAVGVETIGKIEKTIIGLSFAGFESLRRETLIMHNKQESHNALKAAILFGNKGAYRLSADQAIQNRHACLEIVASLLILHNAVHLDAAWKQLLRQGHEISSEHMRRIYPTGTSRVNWLGDLIFADTRDLRIPIDRVKLLKL